MCPGEYSYKVRDIDIFTLVMGPRKKDEINSYLLQYQQYRVGVNRPVSPLRHKNL